MKIMNDGMSFRAVVFALIGDMLFLGLAHPHYLEER